MRRFAAGLKHHSVKTALKSLYPDIMPFGMQALSGHLCEASHNTQLFLLPDRFADDIVAGYDI